MKTLTLHSLLRLPLTMRMLLKTRGHMPVFFMVMALLSPQADHTKWTTIAMLSLKDKKQLSQPRKPWIAYVWVPPVDKTAVKSQLNYINWSKTTPKKNISSWESPHNVAVQTSQNPLLVFISDQQKLGRWSNSHSQGLGRKTVPALPH